MNAVPAISAATQATPASPPASLRQKISAVAYTIFKALLFILTFPVSYPIYRIYRRITYTPPASSTPQVSSSSPSSSAAPSSPSSTTSNASQTPPAMGNMPVRSITRLPLRPLTLPAPGARENPQETLIRFLNKSPAFQANPEFAAFIRARTAIAQAQITIKDDLLTLLWPTAQTLTFDCNKVLPREEFLMADRYTTDKENLLLVKETPRSTDGLQSFTELKMGNLTYIRSFGWEFVVAIKPKFFGSTNIFSIGPKIVLKMNGNSMEFVEGGIMGISSMQFQDFKEFPGLKNPDAEKGIVSFTIPLFGSHSYFLRDMIWLLSNLT